GVVHRTWQPLPHRIKDYIAVPKPNGYRSLHTTIFGPHNRLLEVQFRTQEMHDEAEHGVAAHTLYAERKRAAPATPEQLAIMKRLKSWQGEMGESPEALQRFKIDLFSDRIFVFTPKGEVHSLPTGSCPVDFAYAVHTEVGHSYRGAKVGGRIVPLDTELLNGDVVEILRGPSAAPKRDWLQSVRTGHARNAIRRFFREQDRDVTTAEGRQLLSELLSRYHRPGRLPKDEWKRLRGAVAGAASDDDVLAALGEGRVTQTALAKALGLTAPPAVRNPKRPVAAGRFRVVIGQDLTLPTAYAACCGPRPLVPIVGYVTLRKTITIHRQSCKQLESLPDPSRLVSARWEDA
ncbi:MAG: TGS domain-containing protein, partial [bacterium]|nr:TGS domain-containing protein [bacterium]